MAVKTRKIRNTGPFAGKIPYALSLIKEKIPPQYLKKVWLFGSYAYGRPGKNSDLDFYVVVDNECNDSQIYTDIILHFLHNGIYPCDLLVNTESVFKNALRQNPNNIENIAVKHGVLLYG